MKKPTEVTPELRLTVIKHLAAGKGIDVVATIVGLPRAEVVDIGAHHGYPDRANLARAAELVAAKIEREQQQALPPPARAVSVPSTPDPPAPTAVLTRPDELRVLLNTAKAHPSKRIQKAADRVFDQLDRLSGLLREDEERHAAARKAAREKAEARAEVERLTRQLQAAKAKLAGGGVPAVLLACRVEGCDRTFTRSQGRSRHEGRCPHLPAADAAGPS